MFVRRSSDIGKRRADNGGRKAEDGGVDPRDKNSRQKNRPLACKNYGYAPGDFPVAEDFYRREISLPIFPGLKREEQDYVIHHVWSSVAG